jgi:hypothetical protein
VIVGLAAFAGCSNDDTAPASGVTTGQQAEFGDVSQACDVFTLDMARQVLGDSAKPDELKPFSGSSDDIAGSTCTYQAEDPTPTNQFLTTITATVSLNGAKTATGRSSNRSAFDENRTTFAQSGEGVESLNGLGDAAYYIGGVANQLHVLVDGARYAVIVSASDPDGDNRAATEQLARQVVEKLQG